MPEELKHIVGEDDQKKITRMAAAMCRYLADHFNCTDAEVMQALAMSLAILHNSRGGGNGNAVFNLHDGATVAVRLETIKSGT